MVRQLLCAGADVRAADNGDWTALHIAAARGLTGICCMLLAAGAPLEGFDHRHQTPLMAAITGWVQVYRHVTTVCPHSVPQQLLDTTPQDLLVVQHLLQAGAAVNAANSVGVTALHCAADTTNPACSLLEDTFSVNVIRVLLAAGADVNRADNSSTTALHIAANLGSYNIITALLAPGADANATDSRGRTPLQFIADPQCDRHMPSWPVDWLGIRSVLGLAQQAQSSRKRKAQQWPLPRRQLWEPRAAATAAAAPAVVAAAEVRTAGALFGEDTSVLMLTVAKGANALSNPCKGFQVFNAL